MNKRECSAFEADFPLVTVDHWETQTFTVIISLPAVFPPFCGASSAKCFLLGHHFLSKTALIRTFP